MKKTIFLYLLLFGLMAHADSEVYISEGEVYRVSVPAGQSVRLSGKKYISVTDNGDHLKIVGKLPGQASVTLNDRIIKIFILEKKDVVFFDELETLISQMLGLQVRKQGDEIIVTGDLHRLSDWQKISEVAEKFQGKYTMAAKMADDVLSEAAAWLDSRLATRGLPTPHFVWAPRYQAFIAQDFKSLENHWLSALSPLGIALQFEKSQLAIQPLVRVNIVVAEINKKLQSQTGIEWPNIISAQVAPRFKGPSSLDVFLKAMEQKGLGQVLASPNLLARSGSEADFLAGGEFGIKLISSKSKEVIWKRHGIYLKIKPMADLTGKLSVELSTEVSLIDAAQSVDGIPALKTNRMSTHFDLAEPRTIILSGLIRNDWGKSHSGVYGLASLPVIGGLFRSNDFYNNKSELVIFVTPEIVNPRQNSPNQLLPKGWSTHE